MGFNENQKALALEFAHALANRDYQAALALCSTQIRSRMTAESIGADFEAVIPPDWGEIDPIELVDNDLFPFVYVVLGGDVYSEAVIVDSFAAEDDQERIGSFMFGRP